MIECRRVIGLAVLAALSVSTVGASASREPRPFTVRDSIELMRFNSVIGEYNELYRTWAQFSPNGLSFFVVTSRGDLKTDLIESTIWLYSTAAVRDYTKSAAADTGPKPRDLVRAAGASPPSNDFYPSQIAKVQWLPDSSGILYTVADGSGKRRLYRADLSARVPRAISPPGYDVSLFRYVPSDASVAYVAARPGSGAPSAKQGSKINADAIDLAGADLLTVLSGAKQPATQEDRYAELWTYRNGKSKHVPIAIGAPAQTRFLLNDHPLLSVAPNGRQAIVTTLIERLPSLTWSEYKVADHAPYIRIDPKVDQKARIAWPILQYDLVDLTTGKTSPLVDAPDAYFTYIINRDDAFWSASGRKILLMEAYLPLAGTSRAERELRRGPCFAAVVDVGSRDITCVKYGSKADVDSGGYHDRWFPEGAAFGRTDDLVTLHMQYNGEKYRDDRYRLEHGAWRLVKSAPAVNPRLAASGGLEIAEKESINVLPSLWAVNSRSHARKKLLDPNPQLGAVPLPHVSLITWKDAAGNKWNGDLYSPPGAVAGERRPLVIQTHGWFKNFFAPDGYGTTASAAMPLASAGIYVVQMSGGSSGAQTTNSTVHEPDDALRGFESVIKKLDAAGLIDPKRVGAIGFSRTCWQVENAVIKNPRLFAAVSINDGVIYGYTGYTLNAATSTTFAKDYEHIYGGMPFGENVAKWVAEVPSFHLDRIQAPVLLGTNGPGSPLGYWELYTMLRIQQKPVDFLYFPKGDHILHRPLERLASQGGNVDWFRFWLQGYEDRDPAKRAQYARWRELRALPKPRPSVNPSPSTSASTNPISSPTPSLSPTPSVAPSPSPS